MKNIETHAFLNSRKYKQFTKFKDNRPQEYKLWYNGNINEILHYFKTGRDKFDSDMLYYTPNFMNLVPTGAQVNIGGAYQMNNFTVYHNPVANIISRAMSNLLFSTEPTITFSSKNKKQTKEIELKYEEIKKENNLGSLLQKAAEYESYSGGVAFKPILDPEFSDVPLLEVYAKEDIILNRKYNKIVSIVFLDDLEDEDDNKYTLLSEYGYGYIKYKLISLSNSDKDVPLDTLEETSGLKDLVFFDNNGEALNIILAVYKENRPGGVSDYKNCLDDFAAIDEVYSNLMNFIRKSGPKRIVSESSLRQDINDPDSKVIPSSYSSDIIVRWDNTPEDEKEVNEIQSMPEIDKSATGYLSVMQEILKNIARTTRLSIKTLNGEDVSGANASGEALSIRENVDMKTRDNKLISWNEALISLDKILIILSTIELIDNKAYVNTYNDLIVNIEFYNPSTPTFEQSAKEAKDLLDGNLIDQLGALMRLWFDSGLKSEEEVLEMYALLCNEQESIVSDDEEDMDEDSDDEEKDDTDENDSSEDGDE